MPDAQISPNISIELPSRLPIPSSDYKEKPENLMPIPEKIFGGCCG